jgi:hypothetical protein
MNETLRVLGQYQPSEWNRDVIEQEVRRLGCLPACCRQQRMEIRGPSPHAPATTHLWHRDSDTDVPDAPGRLTHLVMWASEDPTEFVNETGMIQSFEPYDLVWMDNVAWWHRSPPAANHLTRWFIGIRCNGCT